MIIYSISIDRPGLVILAGTGIEPGPGLILNSYVCIYDIIDNTVHIFLFKTYFIYIFQIYFQI